MRQSPRHRQPRLAATGAVLHCAASSIALETPWRPAPSLTPPAPACPTGSPCH